MTFLKIGTFAAVGIYALVLLFFFVFQRAFVFRQGTRLITPRVNETYAARPVTIETADGLFLRALYKAPENGKPTVIYFHGNTGIVEDAMHKTKKLAESGYGVLLPEYRGYGGNTGKPTEKGLTKDAEAALAFVKAQGADKVVYYGMSMGTGVANALAENHPPAAMVQECGFTSMADAGQNRYPFLPVGMLMKDKFDSEKRMKKLTAPVLFLHGEKDATVPVGQMRRNRQAVASADVAVRLYPDGHHVDLHEFGAADDVLKWLEERF